jgi:glycosyltransferase involved in cell wall biosynthesis
MKPVPVLMVTYNRMEYSKRCLESIIGNPGMPVQVMIYDNGSTDGTAEWLDTMSLYGDIRQILTPGKNRGLAHAMNQFFRQYSEYPFVAKIDNDTVMPDNWLRDLMDVMTDPRRDPKLGAVSGTCLRPYGDTFAEWVSKHMKTARFRKHFLHYNSYVLGTGVLINMDLIRERGLLFEKFPRSPEAGPDDPCLISGWTAYIRAAHEYEGWKFAFYSKVPVNLLNIKEEHVLSNDYPEYDAEVQKVRDEGNAWWESVGGLDGVEKYVKEHGGLQIMLRNGNLPIPATDYETAEDRMVRQEMEMEGKTDPKTLTEADHLEMRSTAEFWERRIAQRGTTASTFLDAPQVRVNEFTERHMEVLQQYVTDRDCLDVAVGWGRVSLPIGKMCKSYVGVDFMPALIEKARESMPDMDFRVADARQLPFDDASFDVVISVTGLSSFAAVFDEVLREFHRVLRPGGRILFLEERFVRIDWKLEHE